jgi:hypothetical protein
MSILENYVRLEPGIRKVLHFYDHTTVIREIMDPILGKPKPVKSLVFFVDEEDGRPVKKTFSVIQEKLAAVLAPYLPGKRYLDFNFAITKIGAGFTAEFIVEAIPRPRS